MICVGCPVHVVTWGPPLVVRRLGEHANAAHSMRCMFWDVGRKPGEVFGLLECCQLRFVFIRDHWTAVG